MVQWLRLCVPNAQGPGLIPGLETISHMQQINKNKYFKKFSPQSILEYESCSMVKNLWDGADS